ncbi:MAG: Ig-like domain-containing protein [Lewinella sp.]|uniref:Ig-like domain-containing protein n=1 Tax=Lewinella sp. TaxID=2004506 RepID=UPI003D6AC57B
MTTPFSKYHFLGLILIFSVLLQSSCDKEEMTVPNLSVLNITANGIPLVDGTINVATDATFEISFSSAVTPTKFAAAFSLSSASGVVNNLDINYTNASSKAIISTTLASSTTYELKVNTSALGQNEEALAQPLVRNFTTRDGGVITTLPPCITASDDCLGSKIINGPGGQSGTFTFYNSYPLDLANARWEALTSAVIVVHGLNRDADNYFSYMMSSLRQEDFDDKSILIAPYFKNASAAQNGEIYWSDSGWREGQNSDGAVNISSFTVIDQIIDQLADQDRFPVLETIIIAGHSSGALFTQAYAAANTSENTYPELNFRYVVANSQYFYYPDDLRYDQGTGEFVAVSGCAAYNRWPLGFVSPPPYLSTVPETTVDQQVVERKISYFLGDQDVVTTGSLNTSDCEAVLLGENRFRRGENIFLLMETNYAATHQSEKIVVPGIGHNSEGMFQSPLFLSWLRDKI